MRKIFLYAGTLAMGYTIALGIAYLASWILPEGWPAFLFTIIAGWWTWTGFKYVVIRERTEQARKRDGPFGY